MNYPMRYGFKLIAIAPQISVTDAVGAEMLYVRQKILKLKEHVEIFSSAAMTQKKYDVTADRIIDFSAQYTISNTQGKQIGSIKREGMRSLWSATYVIRDAAGTERFRIKEANPWVKVMDTLFEMLPFGALISGHIFHPEYNVTPANATEPAFVLKKKPAFFEGVFELEKSGAVSAQDEELVQTATLMMVLLERSRG